MDDYSRYPSSILAGLSIQAANGSTNAELKRTAQMALRHLGYGDCFGDITLMRTRRLHYLRHSQDSYGETGMAPFMRRDAVAAKKT